MIVKSSRMFVDSSIRETLNEHIDSLPDNTEMMDMINAVVDQIPTDEEFNDNLDEFSNK